MREVTAIRSSNGVALFFRSSRAQELFDTSIEPTILDGYSYWAGGVVVSQATATRILEVLRGAGVETT